MAMPRRSLVFDEALLARLDALAARLRRSRSWLARELLEDALPIHERRAGAAAPATPTDTATPRGATG